MDSCSLTLFYLATIAIICLLIHISSKIKHLSQNTDTLNRSLTARLNNIDNILQKLSQVTVNKDFTTGSNTTESSDMAPHPVITNQAEPFIQPKSQPTQTTVNKPLTIKIPEPKTLSLPLVKQSNTPPKPNTQTYTSKLYDSIHKLGWEQWLGTRGILLAGIITTIVGGLFFVKYANEHSMLGPLGRVILVTTCGILSCAIGEFTRRKDFGLVARGLTALGFALLYTATFSSYKLYAIISTNNGFLLSIVITVIAMTYAMKLNDRLPAFVALLGGFLSPALLSNNSGNYNALCSYLFILSAGAIFCGLYKKWRVINWLAYLGTTTNLIGWIVVSSIATRTINTYHETTWTSIFFLTFMFLPVIHQLRFNIKSTRWDIALILSNSMISMLYYLRLFDSESDRAKLASAYIFMSIAHLCLLVILYKRKYQDSPLQVSLLTLALFLLTVSLPIYFNGHALAISIAAESLMLSVIAYKYRSKTSEFFAVIAFIITSCVIFDDIFNLTFDLTNHYFTLALAPVLFLVCQYLYRRFNYDVLINRNTLTGLYFISGLSLLSAITLAKWYTYCDLTLDGTSSSIASYFLPLVVPVTCLYALTICIRPLRPNNNTWIYFGTISFLLTTLIALSNERDLYCGKFMIFLNLPFVSFALSVLIILLTAYIVYRQNQTQQYKAVATFIALIGVIFLWLLITFQINSFWTWHGDLSDSYTGKFMATMYISVFWAIYAVVLTQVPQL